ncbi:MAG TPA: hypothetical protein VNI36_05075 [Candidatus Dormibacteraeota bacterium]|nr:hypothetical protein [Candidatus Dormibacteraeota bacterium]
MRNGKALDEGAMPVETAEGQNAKNQVIFLPNFFDEVRRLTATQTK